MTDPTAEEPRYPYVHLDVPLDDVELISYELWEAGALGIEERDATTLGGAPREGFATLVVSLPDEASATALVQTYGRYDARLEHVIGDAWRDAWREHFKPTRVGSRILLRPSWEDVTPEPHEVVLTIDPGQAFGSGIHETTRLVLMEVDGRVREGDTVLDVGCGSGILSVAALLLGAESALCLDIDPLAVDVALENAERNDVGDKLESADTDVAEIEGRYSLVLANIQATVLIPMAPALIARVAAGGTLVLSGILRGQEDEVAAAYAELGEPQLRRENEWVALTYVRPAATSGPSPSREAT